jgi:hypothetical protein
MTEPRAAEIRYRVDPADVPAEKAARRLHLEGDFSVQHLVVSHYR